MTEELLSLDPGRNKIGTAVISRDKEEREKTIVSLTEFEDHLNEIFDKYQINEIIVGNGTGAEKIIKKIEKLKINKKITVVDEKFSTEEAQARYLREKPMSRYEKLLRKFISWKVKKPLDDYAALIIAEKYLEKLDKELK
ncbi:Holliday junction resolvase RuvX [Halanaerobium hydrogeniformans]|uniref:Resolvase RNase H domain protein fold protein n=1 Tax=Halanaerobium hydrogeniformans TaxID=656519 RepID=E4RP79_HALHG|nr:Holliday junction resolvase RuvX [Halanaerobium hydrogeniformans]ADQ13904.1 Resolvase RNase H domain protein fold protein [Halanaerobium hydrogeniformans]